MIIGSGAGLQFSNSKNVGSHLLCLKFFFDFISHAKQDAYIDWFGFEPVKHPAHISVPSDLCLSRFA